jgi:hypothetical protein
MSSNTGTRVAPAAQRAHAPTVVQRLHDLLDDLLGCDLSALSADDHRQLVTLLVRAEHRLHAGVLDAVAAFDAADVASTSRHRTTKQWLQQRTRLSPGAAAHLTRTARALRDHLPRTRVALSAGSVSPQHVSAIAGVVTTIGAEHATSAEPILLELARRFEPSVVRRATSELFALVDPAGAEKALQQAYEKRGLTLSVVGQHGYLNGVFDLESTEVLRAALQPLMAAEGAGDQRTTTQLRADALLDIAQHSLDTAAQPELGGQRPQLSVVVDADKLRTGAGGVTLPWTGAVVPSAVARRWACDAEVSAVVGQMLPPPAAIAVVVNAPSGSAEITGGWLPLQVGRASRFATTGQIKALRVRDAGCVHPGCARTAAYCHAHHVVHWVDGGATDIANLVLLCRHHHRSLHDGMWSLAPDDVVPGRFWASTPDGRYPAQTAADRSPPIRLRPTPEE